MDAFLQELLDRGWSRARRREFVKRYGQTIRWEILYQIRRRFGSQNLSSISSYLLGLQEGASSQGTQGVVGKILDLAVDTWQDVLNEAFKPRENLIHRYSTFATKIVSKGGRIIDFRHFLSKSVHYKFLDNLSSGLSQKEILDRILDLKRENDRHFYINELRNRYGNYIKDDLRSVCRGLHQIDNVIDYFFEEFIPRRYRTIRQERNSGNPNARGSVLDALSQSFGEDDCQKGSEYVRRVYGSPIKMEASLGKLDIEARGRGITEARKIPLNNEVNHYWDQLIRCLRPDPEEVKRELINIDPSEANVLCWACTKLKRGFKREEQRDNLRAFIIFYCSKRGVQQRLSPTQVLTLENLTLEKVAGRDLRWREDVCKTIFGKYIRQDRVAEQIKKEIADSDYAYLISN